TASAVEPLTLPMVAMMLVEPWALPLARPCEPGELETVAVEGDDELHTARLVTSLCEPSEKTPVALNCTVPPTEVVAFCGLTVIVAVPPRPSRVALMVAERADTPLTRPWVPAPLETVAAVEFDDQVASAVTSAVLPSE